MCVCVYVCLCVCARACLCMQINTCTHACVHTYMNTYLHTYAQGRRATCRETRSRDAHDDWRTQWRAFLVFLFSCRLASVFSCRGARSGSCPAEHGVCLAFAAAWGCTRVPTGARRLRASVHVSPANSNGCTLIRGDKTNQVSEGSGFSVRFLLFAYGVVCAWRMLQ